jgi:hypothetical protein
MGPGEKSENESIGPAEKTESEFDALNIYVDEDRTNVISTFAFRWDPKLLADIPFKECGLQLLDCEFIKSPWAEPEKNGYCIPGIPGAFIGCVCPF